MVCLFEQMHKNAQQIERRKMISIENAGLLDAFDGL